MTSARIVPLLALAAMACSYDEAAFQKHYVQGYCARLEVCATWQSLEQLDTCEEDELRRVIADTPEDSSTFDAQRAQRCIHAFYDEECSEGQVPSVCGRVYDAESE